MSLVIRSIGETESAEASAVIRASFMALAASDWEPNAQSVFLSESSPEALLHKVSKSALTLGAFIESKLVGVLLMPTPGILGMLFVHPEWLRRGIAKSLWEHARTEIERAFPTVKTIELNSTPHAFGFYRAVGFAPISQEFTLGGRRATRMACWLPAKALGAETRPSASGI